MTNWIMITWLSLTSINTMEMLTEHTVKKKQKTKKQKQKQKQVVFFLTFFCLRNFLLFFFVNKSKKKKNIAIFVFKTLTWMEAQRYCEGCVYTFVFFCLFVLVLWNAKSLPFSILAICFCCIFEFVIQSLW